MSAPSVWDDPVVTAEAAAILRRALARKAEREAREAAQTAESVMTAAARIWLGLGMVLGCVAGCVTWDYTTPDVRYRLTAYEVSP